MSDMIDMSDAAKPMTTEDVFLGGRLTLQQPTRGFRAGLDAVLLAATVHARGNDGAGHGLRVLDVGAGVGTAGLCVAARIPAARVVLVEVAPSLEALARGNVARNGLGSRVEIFEADITAPAGAGGTSGSHALSALEPGTFDVAIANPPYLEEGRHRLPDDPVAAGAFGMARGNLEAWMRYLARMTTPRGAMALIHRADALAEVLAAIGGRFGELRVLPIHPRAGDAAHRIIVTGRKGSRAPLQLLAGLNLHGEGNAFRPDIQAVLRDGAALPGLGDAWLP